MRKKVMAVVFAILAFSLIAASAATLGGITVADVGADAELVASCDDDGVTVDFGALTYDDVSGDYVTSVVNITDINSDCDGLPIHVTLSNIAGDDYASATGVVTGTTASVSVGYDAEALRRVVVAINGPAATP